MAEQSRKESLSSELRNARAEVKSFVVAVSEDVDFGARLKSNYARNPAIWSGAAAVLGLLLSRILIPRRKVAAEVPVGWNFPVQKSGKLGLVLSALKFAFTIAQPAVVGFISKAIERRLASHNSQR